MIRALLFTAALALSASCGGAGSPADASSSATVPSGTTGGSAAAGKPLYREIGNWIVACDNVRTCTAKAVLNFEEAIGSSGEPLDIKIVRDAGPDGALQVRLDAEDAVDAASFRIDGAPLAARWATGDEARAAWVDGAAALAIVRRLRDGQAATATQGGKTLTASLKGLAAVLLAIDDAQGRVGNSTAFVRPGDAPASSVPTAPALPVLTAALAEPGGQLVTAAAMRRAQARVLKANECNPNLSQDSVDRLADGSTIVLLQCDTYAYQDSSLVFRVFDPAKAWLVVLPPLPTDDDKDTTPGQYVSAYYDAATATLGWSSKGRGIADCGREASYVFDGRDFRLASFNRQDGCGGRPGDWPAIYRSTVRKR